MGAKAAVVVNGTLFTLLEEIATHHSGLVPVHGRLFSQWLHYAFPHECPYPHMAGTISRDWAKKQGIEDVTKEEMDKVLESEIARRPLSPDAGKSMWTLEEELL